MEEAFYDRAYARLTRFMIVLAIVFTVALSLLVDVRWAIGFAVGSAIAFLNFHWLKRVVSAIADRATRTERRQSSKGLVARFLLRYFLMAAGAYAIFRISSASAYGLLAGLFLPVGAIALEAAYELWVSLRHGGETEH